MSLAVFRAALEVAQDHDQALVLGGGEPTLHPHFETMAFEAMALSSHEFKLLVVTNGTHKRRSLMLASLNQKELLHAELSLDVWHSKKMVCPEVRAAFGDSIRNVTGGEKPQGRYLETVGLEWGDVDIACACDDWVVEPDGTIKQCACQNAPVVGSVSKGIHPRYSCCSGMCFNTNEFRQELDDQDYWEEVA